MLFDTMERSRAIPSHISKELDIQMAYLDANCKRLCSPRDTETFPLRSWKASPSSSLSTTSTAIPPAYASSVLHMRDQPTRRPDQDPRL